MCDNASLPLLTTIAHQSLPYFIVFSFIYNLYWMNNHPLMVNVAILAVSIIILSLKELFLIERPTIYLHCGVGIGHAFPSWHAVILGFLVVFYGHLFYMHSVWKTWGVLKTILRVSIPMVYIAFVIDLRVYIYTTYWLTFHSFVMGTAFAGLFILFIKRYKLENYAKYE